MTTLTFTFTESPDHALRLAAEQKGAITSVGWANRLLAGAALQAPEGGAYDKTELVIRDGEWSYTARIDLTREMATQPNIIVSHLQDVVRWADRELARAASGTPSAYVKKDGTGPAPTMKDAALRALGLLTFVP
jgi:hypothetical protein